jgi:hypothetical protein
MDRESQERMRLDWPTGRTIDALENIATVLERLRVLKEYELGVRIREAPDGNGPYVPREPSEAEEE